MAARSLHPEKTMERAVALAAKIGIERAAGELKLPPSNVRRWAKNAKVNYSPARSLPKKALLEELCGLLGKNPDLTWHEYKPAVSNPGAHLKHWNSWNAFRGDGLRLIPDGLKTGPDRVFRVIKPRPLTLDQVAAALHVARPAAQKAIEHARAAGYDIHLRGEHYRVEQVPEQVGYSKDLHLLESDESGVIRYGVVSDNHIGSKYARLDVLNNLYDFFQKEGVTRVYNCGNWIDGEARFNRHDLEPWAHGMDNQLRGFAEHYPKRKGIETFYVAGDDHEGWYDGVDIGLRAQQTARDMGRTDVHYLGYMEAFVRLRHKRTHKSSVGAFVHPGGGASYALSYSPQKIVESYQGGEKPAVVHFGHYHKMDAFNYRNVWIQQVGCTQDQTPFMRKLRIEAHLGGVLIELIQEPGGAVSDFKSWMKRYFDRGYYNFQFDRAGPLKRIPLAA